MSHRTQITLTDEQYRRLLQESERTGVSLAELIRRAVERSYGDVDRVETVRAIEESAGAWTGREFDGKEYVESLRKGMARRLSG
jgi:hypothetical protein